MVSEEGYEEEWQEGDEWNESYEGYWADDQSWNEGYWASDDVYYLDEYGYSQKKGKGKGKKGKKGKDDDGKGGKPGDELCSTSDLINPCHTEPTAATSSLFFCSIKLWSVARLNRKEAKRSPVLVGDLDALRSGVQRRPAPVPREVGLQQGEASWKRLAKGTSLFSYGYSEETEMPSHPERSEETEESG